MTVAGILSPGNNTLTLTHPADTLPASSDTILKVYPNLGAHLREALVAVADYRTGVQSRRSPRLGQAFSFSVTPLPSRKKMRSFSSRRIAILKKLTRICWRTRFPTADSPTGRKIAMPTWR